MAGKTEAGTEQPRPWLVNNWISIIGIILALSSFFAAACLIAIDFFRGLPNPYAGILTYLVAPAFLIAGLLLISIGALWERRRRRRLKPGEILRYPRIDLNVPGHRHTFIAIAVITFIFLLTTALGSYRTYQFTESVTFCGEVCHQVMAPQFTAYRESPHARVACVACHIGPGATWFVRSKLSGVYQVYATLMDTYPRPIPTPIKNLRPVEDTCEQCHWPLMFHGAVERVIHRYLSDEQNSAWTIRMLLRVGGGNPLVGPTGGIHWRHMRPDETIEYIAADKERQDIPWVRVTDRQGKMTVYRTKDNALTAEQISLAQPRVMDCIDCHNRPTHIYHSPDDAVDLAISTGRIDRSIPYIKKQAVAALTADYRTDAEAMNRISESLTGYYRTQYANFTKAHSRSLSQAVAEMQKIYANNFFPRMKVNWRVYPNDLGHKIFPGCFRCHDGNHVSEAGETITKNCDACHTIMAQGAGPLPPFVSSRGLEFKHPVDIQDAWRQTLCSACHDGAQ